MQSFASIVLLVALLFYVGKAGLGMFRLAKIFRQEPALLHEPKWKKLFIGLSLFMFAGAWEFLVVKLWPPAIVGSLWELLIATGGAILIACCGFYFLCEIYFDLKRIVQSRTAN